MRETVIIPEPFHLKSHQRMCSEVLPLAAICISFLTACGGGSGLTVTTPASTPSAAAEAATVPATATFSLPAPSRTARATSAPQTPEPSAAGNADSSSPTAVNSMALSGKAARGQVVFASHCAECHDDIGGGLPGVLPRYEQMTPKYIEKVVREGLQIACCTYMGVTSKAEVSDDDLQAIIEYLKAVEPQLIFDSDN